MTTQRDLDALLSEYLADGMTVLPDRVADAVVGEAQRTRQRTMVGRWRTVSVFRVALSAAAVVVFLGVGVALLGQRGRNDVVSPPTSSPVSSANPTQHAAVPVSPTPTAAVAPSSAPTNQALNLDLTWQEVDMPDVEQVAWVGNQFVLRHADGTISASSDGANWHDLQPGSDPGYGELLRDGFAIWQDDVVGWWNPKDPRLPLGEHTQAQPAMKGDIVNVLQPPAARIESTPFTGRIETMGVGPAGIVAQVKAPRDDRPGYGWYSADGTQWTEVQFDRDFADSPQTLPRVFREVAGVSDGFIARDDFGGGDECPDPQNGCSTMWHSSDGLTWTKLGITINDGSRTLLPWKGGALLTDGISRFDLWTSAGSSELPLAGEVPTPAGFGRASVGTGPLGLVTMLFGGEQREALLSRDGVDWKIQPAPPVPPPDFSSIAVGKNSLLYLGWAGSIMDGETPVPHLWVGSVNP